MHSLSDKNKLVSVIIPFYNRIELLKKSVQSVLNQTYNPVELIIVDDHSEELFDYNDVLKLSREDISIKVVRNEKNIGPGLSRETGRLLAKGDYFAYLDSDDFWHAEFLEKLVSYLERNEDVGMAYSKTMLIRTSGNFLRNKNEKAFNQIVPVIFDIHGRPWATGACVWKREIVNKIGPWSKGRIWEDYEYDIRAAIINNNIIHVPEVLFFVNMDSKQKISLIKNTTNMIVDKANSILNIARNLRKSRFFHDKEIQKRISYYLLTACATLSDNKYNKNTIRNLFKEYYNWKKGTLMFVNAVVYLSPSKVNSKIYRKIRQISAIVYLFIVT